MNVGANLAVGIGAFECRASGKDFIDKLVYTCDINMKLVASYEALMALETIIRYRETKDNIH